MILSTHKCGCFCIGGNDERTEMEALFTLLDGLTAYEWRKIREVIDRQYKAKAAKTLLDGDATKNLKNSISREFIQ